jgi:ABC-type antimicrobial peptide transport system permease subunit
MRVALGASPRAVMSMVLRQSLTIVLTGAAVGMGLGIIAGRMLRSVLFDVSPTDPFTLVGVASFFIGVALIASFVPAFRAAHIEPTRALQAD